MATREELYGALRNADAAGDTAAAQRLAAYIQSMPADAPTGQGEPEREERNADGALVIRMSQEAPRAPAQTPKAPASVSDIPGEGWAAQTGRAIMEVPRQVGLTARYGLEGLGQASQLFTEPIRAGVNAAVDAVGLPPEWRAAPSGNVMSSLADTIGLPSPENAEERVVGDAARLMAGGGGLLGGAGALARGATGMTQAVLSGLSAAPFQQIAGGAGAGLAGGAVREAGGGPVAQGVAGLAGGLAGPFGASLVSDGINGTRNMIGRMLPGRPEQIDLRIEGALSQAGVDWSAIPERIRQSVRTEVSQALKAGDELRPDAIARLVDFKSVDGAVPTRGMVTLDPVQITRERNLAKTGANSSDRGLQGLARVENENNTALIRALNRAGASDAPDAYVTGERVMGSLQRGLDAERGNINTLYSQARDSAGRSFPLDGAAFTKKASTDLADNLLGGSLPRDIRRHLNEIAQGKVPFTVDYAEQLKTRLGALQRASSDGSVRKAISVVRSALDEAPVLGLGQQTAAAGARAVNPGNLPAIPGQPGVSLGEDAIAAFNQARGANRAMMQRIEESPALKAIYEGDATPDQFVQKFIVGPGATVKDVRAIKSAIKDDPEATQAAQGYIAAWLKEKALGGRSDEVGAFSPANYNRAVRTIGDRKLAAFFEPEQIAQLKAVGRVGDYMKAQPVGSAVNNSNSGALLMGRGLDLIDKLSAKVPLLGIGPTIQGVVRGVQQQSAQNVAPGLLSMAQQQPRGLLSNMAPATMYGGLLSLPPAPGRDENNRR